MVMLEQPIITLLMSGNAAHKGLFTLGFRTTAPDLLGEAKGDQRLQGYVCTFILHFSGGS